MTPLRRLSTLIIAALTASAPSTVRADVAVTVTVDPTTGRKPISPFIYGSNQDIPQAPLTAMRQGGNRMTGYNWENNASHAGEDYYNQNDNFLTWIMGISGAQENTPGIVVTRFHQDTQARGAAYSVVTLQLAGYVSKDKSGVVTQAQQAPSSRWVPISFTKPTALSTTPDTTDNAVYMDEFVNLLVTRFGSASTSTGVRGYCLDNEPDLWSSTHPRLHPAKPGCAELVTRNTEGAKAIKRIDPAAETLGFVSYGFGGYYDYQGATDWPTERTKGSYRWFVDYYLDQMKKASDTAGLRLLDSIDLHNYSEARGGGTRVNDASTWENIDCNKARMQAPRSYWDATYTEESWIGQWFSGFLPLLPNVQASIAAFYPGTKLALTEYNFGGESHISGGIAQADTLGIFADQSVYLACWWQLHDNPTYTAAAFRLYLDYDGAGGTVGDTAVASSVNDRSTCSVHASVDADDPTKLHLILLNKSYDQRAVASIQIGGTRHYTSARVFAFDATSDQITERAGVASIANNTLSYTLPALTAAHVVLSAAASAPSITTHPQSRSVTAGGSTQLTVSAQGSPDGTLTYQWQFNGVDITGATAATYSIPSTQAFHAGSYTCIVSEDGASTTSTAAIVTVTPAPASQARLLNLSTRALGMTGSNQLIPGFVLSGTGTKRMLIRAVGPGLQDTFQLNGVLPDPVMALRNQDTATQVAANDEWSTGANKAEIIATAASVGAFPLLEGSHDAVLLVDLPAGSYTAPTVDTAGDSGLAMVELYDADLTPSTCQLINISNRGFVDVGNAIMIPGFVVSSEGARTVLLRAVGPGLATTFGLSGILADPVLTVFSQGNPILTIDDWQGAGASSNTAAVATQVGAFPLQADSTDAAFVVTLPPGAYTVQVTGKGGSTGVALAEVYLVP